MRDIQKAYWLDDFPQRPDLEDAIDVLNRFLEWPPDDFADLFSKAGISRGLISKHMELMKVVRDSIKEEIPPENMDDYILVDKESLRVLLNGKIPKWLKSIGL